MGGAKVNKQELGMSSLLCPPRKLYALDGCST